MGQTHRARFRARATLAVTAVALAAALPTAGRAGTTGIFGPYTVTSGAVIRYAGPPQDTMIECKPVATGTQWNGPFPAIMLVHGGGWSGGTNAIGPAYTGYSGSWCQLWASWGFHAFSVSYRLTKVAKWPAQLVDVQAAVRYVRANAATLNVNPALIGGEGDSAGGSLIEQVGMTHTVVPGDLSAYLPTVDPILQFMVAQFGPWSWGPASATAPVPANEATREFAKQTQPADAMFIQGTNDTLVEPSQSGAAYCRLRQAGYPAHYLAYPGGHEFTGLAGPAWSGIVGTLQTKAIAFAFAHGHAAAPGADPAIPTSFVGPVLPMDDATVPAC